MASIAALEQAKPAIDLPIEQIANFCVKWHVIEFALFGSVLRSDFSAGSDVDVMVTFDPKADPTLLTIAQMQRELEGLFKRPVDLLERHGVEQMENFIRRPEILRTARVIYAR